MGNASEVYMQELEELMSGGWFAMLFSDIPSMLVEVATYVFTALALYTIAKRRGINNPWLAWIPVANVWLLGCIADQYRYIAKGEIKSRRKVLLGLQIVQVVLSIALVVLCVVMVVELMAVGMDNLENITEGVANALIASLVGPVVAVVLMAIPMMVVAITYLVFYYICLHDIYKSCDPSNATLYLLLSIFIGITQPIFLFICRNKDGGMPIHQQAQPVVEAPVEPWEQPEQ